MNLFQFLSELNIPQYTWVLKTNPNTEIYACKPFYQDESSADPCMIYMGAMPELDAPPTQCSVNFLCVGELNESCDTEELRRRYPNANLIVVPPHITIKELYDRATDCFVNVIHYSDYINRLVSAFNANKGLSFLIDEAYGITKCPLVVMDISYKILAISHITAANSTLAAQQALGYATEETVKRMKRDQIYEKLRCTPYPLYNKAEDDEHGWLNSLVYLNGIEVAEIGMMEYNRRFTHYDSEFINFLRHLVSLEMQKNDFYKNNRGMMYSIFLSELLGHRMLSKHIINYRKKLLSWEDFPYMYVLTVFLTDARDFKQQAEVFAMQMQNILTNCRWVIYEDNLVILIQQNAIDIEKFKPGSPVYDRIKLNHLHAVLSNCFSNLSDMRKYYEQTLFINSIRSVIKEERAIYIYNDYVFYHIGAIIAERHNLCDFYHPAILAIRNYDEKNHTAYLPTLTEYLIHINDPATCSRNLFIHKNTFFYRMNKIREMFHLNLNDGMERLKLHLTLELMKLE